MAVLVLGRAVQGPRGRRGDRAALRHRRAGLRRAAAPRLFGAFAAGWVLPALVGPLAAGLVTTHVGWRACSWAWCRWWRPVSRWLLTAAPGAAPAGTPSGRAAGPVRRSALLAGAGIAALQYAAQRLDLAGAGIAVLGAAGLAVALRRLLPPGTVRVRRGLPAVVASRGLLAGAFFGVDACCR
jgi:hypothetical protein